ncbi:MAG: MerR family transcriptional regulator [Tannerellaceae bacterium]|jgi:DNA-binding transcriptional MerR regulator|nr:MerR family transcriptional regulator [Tannerellaceae bacterium]
MAREKLYYSISEVSQLLGVEESTLRFWEKVFGKPKPFRRVERGPRLYRAEDVDTLRQIYHLLRERGMTIEGAKRQLRHNRSAVADKAELLLRLRHVKEELTALQEAFDHIPLPSDDEPQQA